MCNKDLWGSDDGVSHVIPCSVCGLDLSKSEGKSSPGHTMKEYSCIDV